MKNSKSVYNADKENSIFAIKLRGLFEETKRTQQELIDFIQIKTGKAPTRQAVSAWTHGNSPDIKTVPIIAKFFNVSTDYLLTETEVRPLDVELTAICEYTGLSPKSIENLRAIRTRQLNADLLLEKDDFEDIIKHLCEIEWLEKARRYFDLVINTIEYGDEFYDNLTLNNVRVCYHCEKNARKASSYPVPVQDCEKCDADIKWDKDYILVLICNGLNKTVIDEFGPEIPYRSNHYQDKIDLEEFKLTKSVAEIIEEIKDNVDCSSYFLEKNRQVREHLIKELEEIKELEIRYESGKKSQDNYAPNMSELKAKKIAIQTYLDKYDESFKLKKGSDKNG